MDTKVLDKIPLNPITKKHIQRLSTITKLPSSQRCRMLQEIPQEKTSLFILCLAISFCFLAVKYSVLILTEQRWSWLLRSQDTRGNVWVFTERDSYTDHTWCLASGKEYSPSLVLALPGRGPTGAQKQWGCWLWVGIRDLGGMPGVRPPTRITLPGKKMQTLRDFAFWTLSWLAPQ